jgi:hypothetical protein
VPQDDRRPKITTGGASYRTTADSHDHQATDCSVTLKNLTHAEFEAVTAFLLGKSYIRCVDGRLEAHEAHRPLPGPTDDPVLAPHWRPGTVKEFGGPPAGEGWHHPGIILTALGAGVQMSDFMAADRLKRDMENLLDCGFECLRSRPDRDGKRWEQWVLHSPTFARGKLKAHLEEWRKQHPRTDAPGNNWHAEAEEICRYLTRDLQIAYGSLDITIQRWALCCDD